jgi:uncharacterized protein YcaQ
VELSGREARRLALSAQGLHGPRPVPSADLERRRLRRLVRSLGAIQVDAVNVLARTQFLVPFSRIGPYDRAHLLELSRPGGAMWEYWGHAASLLPVELYPLFRHRMDRWRADQVDSPAAQARRRAWREANAGYLAAVLAEIDQRGPLSAAQLSDPRRNHGTWWERRSDGRRALEVLFADGVLAAWRGPGFERVYDRMERVIPASILARPAPPAEEAHRDLLALAASCCGVGTAGDLAEYFWIRPQAARPRIAELVEEGRLVEVAVEGWGRPAYMAAGSRPGPLRRDHATLLSPFDSLIWTRERTERLFGFRYRIEIYVPQPQRKFGYYVMPLLQGDELVARLDLKADRASGSLRVAASHLEPGADEVATAEAAAAELHRMRRWLGLQDIQVAERGDLAQALAKATR